MKNPLVRTASPDRSARERPAELQAHILGQHDELQRLFRTAAVLATAAARGDRDCQSELPNLLDLLLGKLQAHLDFEEGSLFPVLATADTAAAEHILALVDEHHAERRQLRRLLEQSRTSPDARALAPALEALAHELRQELADEQRWLREAVLAASPRSL